MIWSYTLQNVIRLHVTSKHLVYIIGYDRGAFSLCFFAVVVVVVVVKESPVQNNPSEKNIFSQVSVPGRVCKRCPGSLAMVCL